MKPFLDELKAILECDIVDVNTDKINYQNVVLYQLNNIVKQNTISNTKNQYNVFINLYYVTKATDKNHSANSFKLLNKLERSCAKAIQKMTCSRLVIVNASEYLATQYDLCFTSVDFK